jgi:uncharacterized membrane-anchored protein
MISKLRPLLYMAALVLTATPPSIAQKLDTPPEAGAGEAAAAKKFKDFVDALDWKTEGDGALGGMATLRVPSGYRFTGNAGTLKLMEMYGNLTSGTELGYISPLDMGWFAVFEFQDCGYVKDDEKNKLDADKILSQLKEGQVAANQELSKRGMPTLEVLGWQTPPFYNPQTNNLEWAIRLRGGDAGDGGETINYKTKLLGRRGVMDVVLVCDEAQLSSVIPEYQKLLKGFAYKKEESYAAFSKGDKVATYGLTGLIVGGGVLALAKTGLLAKFWKIIVVAVIAVGAFIKRIFTGKTQESI